VLGGEAGERGEEVEGEIEGWGGGGGGVKWRRGERMGGLGKESGNGSGEGG